MTIGIICACMPCLNPLVRVSMPALRRTFGSRSSQGVDAEKASKNTYTTTTTGHTSPTRPSVWGDEDDLKPTDSELGGPTVYATEVVTVDIEQVYSPDRGA